MYHFMKYLSLFRVRPTKDKFDESHVFHETRYRSIHILFLAARVSPAALVRVMEKQGLFFGFP